MAVSSLILFHFFTSSPPHLEFNFYADPQAASIVLSSGLPITLVPLDVTEMCRLRYGVYQEALVPLAHHAPLPSFVTEFLMHIYDYMSELHEDLSGGINVKRRATMSPHGTSNSIAIQSSGSLLDVSNEVRVDTPAITGRTPHATTSERMALESMIESEQRQRIRATQASSLAMHDVLCMGVVIDQAVIKRIHSMPVTVETCERAATRGMCIVDGRRWKTRTNAQQDRDEFRRSLLGQGPKPVDVVMHVDTDRFFEKFMTRVFGVSWDPTKHAWKELDGAQ